MTDESVKMIKLTKLNGNEFFLNPDLVEKIEITPNTVITMNSQIQYLVKESVEEIKTLILNEKKSFYSVGV